LLVKGKTQGRPTLAPPSVRHCPAEVVAVVAVEAVVAVTMMIAGVVVADPVVVADDEVVDDAVLLSGWQLM